MRKSERSPGQQGLCNRGQYVIWSTDSTTNNHLSRVSFEPDSMQDFFSFWCLCTEECEQGQVHPVAFLEVFSPSFPSQDCDWQSGCMMGGPCGSARVMLQRHLVDSQSISGLITHVCSPLPEGVRFEAVTVVVQNAIPCGLCFLAILGAVAHPENQTCKGGRDQSQMTVCFLPVFPGNNFVYWGHCAGWYLPDP